MANRIAGVISRHRRWSRLSALLEANCGASNGGLLPRLGATALRWPVRCLNQIALHRLLAKEAGSLEEAREKFVYVAALMMSAKLELNRDQVRRLTLSLGRFRPYVLI